MGECFSWACAWVVQGNATSAALESAVFPNGSTIVNATAPGGRGTRQLYGLFWQLRGGECRCALVWHASAHSKSLECSVCLYPSQAGVLAGNVLGLLHELGIPFASSC